MTIWVLSSYGDYRIILKNKIIRKMLSLLRITNIGQL